MTPEQQAFLDALTAFFSEGVLVQLVDLLSFALGAAVGLSFVVASSLRWD